MWRVLGLVAFSKLPSTLARTNLSQFVARSPGSIQFYFKQDVLSSQTILEMGESYNLHLTPRGGGGSYNLHVRLHHLNVDGYIATNINAVKNYLFHDRL